MKNAAVASGKYEYSLDSNGCLIARTPDKRLLRLKGKLGIDKDNRLIYRLNEPAAWRRNYRIPGKIVFKGSWQLSRNRDLELVLSKGKNQREGEILTIKGAIISAQGNSLVFETRARDENGLLHVQILQLSVIWLADKDNHLSFVVKKHIPDILTLEGNWRINRNQQLTYTYEKTELKRKTKVAEVLTFEGSWQFSKPDRLTYVLSQGSDSKFDLRAQIETPNIYAQDGAIKYRLGAGVREGRKIKEKIISIYGVWKLSRKLGLSFQINYGKERFSEAEFGADIALGRRNDVSFSLKNKEGKPLGINVIFRHKFLKSLDAEAFLRLKVSAREREAGIGVRIPF